MTRDEFEAQYAARSNMTVEQLHGFGLYGEPCECGESICEGWAMNWERRAERASDDQ